MSKLQFTEDKSEATLVHQVDCLMFNLNLSHWSYCSWWPAIQYLVRMCRSGQPASRDTWHRLTVSRTGREAYLTLDGQEAATGLATAPGAFTQLSLGQDLWVGGVPGPALLSAYLPITRGFQGCIQKVGICI